MSESDDIHFMKVAMKLAEQGCGFVNPNPMVGAVIVKNRKIIGKGFHEHFGGPHAEINALKGISGVAGATLYVTLEPCNHYGKTPPCTERIISEKFKRVVVGIKDPNPLMNGKGIRKLRNAGIKVETGVMKLLIQRQNEIYLKYITKNLPFCALKTAMTLDGKIATYNGDSRWISNEQSREFVHDLRHRYAAIMVGINTVITDNPELRDRSAHSEKKNPLRIIVDSTGRTPADSKIMDTRFAPTLFAVTERTPNDFVNRVRQKGCDVIVCPEKGKQVNLEVLMKKIAERGIDSVLIEGGGTLNFSAIQAGIVDKVYSFISPRFLGGSGAPTPLGGSGIGAVDQAVNLEIDNIRRFGGDLLIESYISNH